MSGTGKGLFLADWERALFIHFRIEPHILAPFIPFELDTFDGDAYFSLVAFTQRNLRPTIGGRLSAMLSQPLASHEFLNLRTYVRVNGETGIYFIAEWIPNRLAAFIGPRMYGLPYRLGTLRYRHDYVRALYGSVKSRGHSLSYRAHEIPNSQSVLDEFLLRHYTAYTHHNGIARRFRIAHDPWVQTPVHASLVDSSLLRSAGDWTAHATLISANFSPGVCDVGISAPEKLAANAVFA